MPDYDLMDRLRADKWLWYARIVKTRSLAAALIKSGNVRLNNERIGSPSRNIAAEDVLTVTLERQIKILRVKTMAVRRGPASEAQLMYEDLSPPPVRIDPATRPALQAVRDEGAGRPTKKERREISRFRQNANEEF